ncbi:phage portal protein [Clostridium niameyense]|uniref:phage portal protein n=1 Tax=Clostridium niameyense TaxID=1622073 RepID=UPI001969AEBE
MGLWSKFKSFFNKTKSKYGNFEKWFSPYNIFAKLNNYTLANNETIFSAVTRLSNSLASLPLKLYKDYEVQKDNLSKLVELSPDGKLTEYEWIRLMEVFRNTTGNAYALKRYNKFYQVEGLDILNPNSVEPVIEKNSKELYYKIINDNGTFYFHNMDVIHVAHIRDGTYKGINPLDVLRGSIEYDNRIKEFNLAQMENGLKASFAIKISSNLSKENKEDLRDQLKKFYANNGGGAIVLDNGQEIKELKNSIIDPKIFEAEKITIGRVARVFNIPAHKLGIDDKSNYATREQEALEYIQDTMLPIVRMYEQELNRKLLSDSRYKEGYSFKFSLNGLARADMNTRGNFYFKGIRSMLFKPNEVRAWEELPPEKGGDQLFASRDLIPIDKIDLLLQQKNNNTGPNK